MTPRAQKITSYLKQSGKEFISFVSDLVEAESPSTKPDTLQKPFSILSEAYTKIDYKTTYFPGKDSGGQLLITSKNREKNNPVQLLLGHCDTVWPVGSLQDCPCNQNGNMLSGPGVYDMKAGLGMMLFALRAIKNLELKLNATPLIFINSDEELGSNDSKKSIIRLAKCASRVFVLEPSLGNKGKIKTERKGVGHFEITVKGKAAHAGLEPESGVSAILGLSNVVQQLYDLNDPAKGTTVNVGTIQGGERSNVVAALSKASVDVRIKTKEEGQRIEKAIRSLNPKLPGIELEIKGGIERPPMEKKPENIRLWKLTKKLAGELELDLDDGLSGGASDGNFTNMYAPTIDGLGAVGEGAHALHEKIFIEETLQRCALLTLLLTAPINDK